MTHRAQQRQGECEGRERAIVTMPRHSATVFNNEGAVAACCARACFFFSLARALALRASCVNKPKKKTRQRPPDGVDWFACLLLGTSSSRSSLPPAGRTQTYLVVYIGAGVAMHAGTFQEVPTLPRLGLTRGGSTVGFVLATQPLRH